MTSSKYIQLTDKILMEYEYFNFAESTSDERKEFQIPVEAHVYTNIENLFKYVVSESFTKNRANNTKIKVSDFTAADYFYCLAETNPNKYVAKDGDDNNATAEEFLYYSENYIPENISSQKINCDKVKIYFASSYDEDKNADGRYTISISTNYKYYKSEEDKRNNISTPKQFILANYILDGFKNVPTPFLIGERLYSRVIEFYVPSVKDNPELFNEELERPGKIDIKCSNIFKESKTSYHTTTKDSINILSIVEQASLSISGTDQYATVFASIEEIDDYFKLEGATKNTWKTFNDFIADLPGTPNDYILMHDITVNELLTNTSTDEPDWKITTHNIITQTDDFDEPVLFRPVIKYSNCIACVIDYTLRIYCNSNNTQIIKRATYQNFNFSKYGKKLLKINLGVYPPQINVYNKIDNDKIDKVKIVNSEQRLNVTQEKIFKTSYITSFRDRINIKASIAPVKIDDITE